MYVHKLLLSIIFLINYLCAQSVFNSFGLGLSPTSYHTSVNGAGSIGLVPTFHPGVSMENAATWPGLNYTFISASYSNQLYGNEKPIDPDIIPPPERNSLFVTYLVPSKSIVEVSVVKKEL